MNRLIPFLFLLVPGSAALAQTTPTTAKLPAGYIYEVKPALANKRVFVCAQQPVDANGDIVGTNDLTRQTTQAMDNIREALSKKGLTLDDVTQVSYRIKDLSASPQMAQAAMSAASTGFSGFQPNLVDYMNVAAFQRPGMLLEIEVIAIK